MKKLLKSIKNDRGYGYLFATTVAIAIYAATVALKPILEPIIPTLYMTRAETFENIMKRFGASALAVVVILIVTSIVIFLTYSLINKISEIQRERRNRKMEEELEDLVQSLSRKKQDLEKSYATLKENITTIEKELENAKDPKIRETLEILKKFCEEMLSLKARYPFSNTATQNN
jgi:predicted PurR-regulated permease PerM